jgi:hypothetical protein
MFRGQRSAEPKWKVENGVMETTPEGGIFSKEEFGDCQLHVEWAAPSIVKGDGQGRGNSGVYLMGRYEIQVLDCYQNKTYPNGQCGAFYGHNAPLVNACRKPGEWQAYDIIFHAPIPHADGSRACGSFTVLHNGVLIQDNIPIGGDPTTAAPLKGMAEKGPLYLQDHGNPVRFPECVGPQIVIGFQRLRLRGMRESGPTIYCWVNERKRITSPGRTEEPVSRFLSPLSGLGAFMIPRHQR